MSVAADHASLSLLVDQFRPGGCYGIKWQLSGELLTQKEHYNPQWRIDAVKANGLTGLYTERSSTYVFSVGQGLVGRVFAKQETLFVPDLQALDEESVKDAMQSGESTEFLRMDLAKEFNLHSAIFVPVPNGVLEIGSCRLMTAPPQDFVQYVSMSILPADIPTPPPAVSVPTPQPPPFLQKLVEKLTFAGCYGIEWAEVGGILQYRSHFNPQWRVEGLRQQGLDGAYTTESMGITFEKGEGLVGSVFANQSLHFARDVQDVTTDDVKGALQSGNGGAFLRADIARKFGIHSMLLLPFADGVLEVGTIKICDNLQGFLSDHAAEAVSGKTSTADIVGVLHALTL